MSSSSVLYVAASFAGSGHPPNWFLNLVADPSVMVETGSTRGRYSARVLNDVAAGQVWPRLDAVYPSFATYRQRTTRTIQIVELSPLGRADEAPLTSVG